MESQPQNPEFRNNPENFQPCYPAHIFCADNVVCLLHLLRYIQMHSKLILLQKQSALLSSLIWVHIVCNILAT